MTRGDPAPDGSHGPHTLVDDIDDPRLATTTDTISKEFYGFVPVIHSRSVMEPGDGGHASGRPNRSR